MEKKRGMLKRPLIFIILLVILSVVVTANYQTIYNAFTQRLDYVLGNDLSGDKVYLGEADVANNLTVHGYIAIVANLENLSVSNLTLINVSDELVYDLNFTDILNNTFKAYSTNKSNASALLLLNSQNYSLDVQRGKFNLLSNRWNLYNITLDFDRFYLPVNLSAGDLYANRTFASFVNASTMFIGPQNWSDNQNYPAPCPDGSYLTQLGDSVTCTTAVRLTGDNMTGNLNMTGNNITSVGDLYVDTIHGGSPVRFADGINLSWNGTIRNITSVNYLIADFLQGNGEGLVNLTASNETYLERNATTDLNMTNNDVSNIDKLLFNLGEYIDNLVDGWLKLWGNLHVEGNLNVSENLSVTNRLSIGNQTLFDGGLETLNVSGGLYITKNASVFDLVVRSPASIQLGTDVNFTAMITTASFDTNVSGVVRSRTGIEADKDLTTVQYRENGTAYIGVFNVDNGTFSNAVSLAQNSRGFSMAMNKYGSSYVDQNNVSAPNRGDLLNIQGDLRIMNQNVSLIPATQTHNIIFGFFEAFSANAAFDFFGFLNETYAMLISPNLNITMYGNVSMAKDLNVDGNITASNVWIPQYIAAHTDAQQAITSGGLWVNISFNDSATALFQGITHTYNDATNDTFTIADTGIYSLTYALDIVDSAGSPDAHVAARFVKNGGTEIDGTLFEIDTDKQNSEEELSLPDMLADLTAGDTIKLQYTSDDTTVKLMSQGTFGDHPDSAVMTIKRIA